MPLSKRRSAQHNASCYLREVQPDLQDVQSTTDQIALAREHATRQGWQIVGEFTDAAISGASMVNCRGLQDLMRSAEARKFDSVLTESLDRLSRDLADSAALHKQLAYWGVRVVTLADGDVNKILVAVKGLLGSMFLRRNARDPTDDGVGVSRIHYAYAFSVCDGCFVAEPHA